jgi:O-antigen ligase
LNSRSTLLDLRPGLRVFAAAVSFESVFILFLISVNYKDDPRFSWFPVDSTIIFLVVGVAIGMVIIYREGIYLPGLAMVSLLIVFIVWALLTSLWTPSELYAHEKLLKLATLNLWTLIATAMIIANRPERVRRFLVLVLVLGTAASLDGIVQYATTGPLARSAAFRLANYLGQGRFFGMAALVAFGAWLYADPFSRRGVALMAAFVTCVSALLVGGGRGPTLGVIAGMLLPLALGLRFVDRRLLVSKALVASIVLFVAMAAAVLQVAATSSEELPTLQRFHTLLTEEEGGQSDRLNFWRRSWHLWLEQPVLGSGVGSWPIRYFGLDVPRYPHNLILEVLVEFGLIGLLLLAGIVIVAVRGISVRRLREDPILMCVAMLCINTSFYAMTSSDITQNRNVFATLGLLVMRAYGQSSHVSMQNRARDLSSSGRPHSDLHQGVPDARRGGL